MPDCTTYTAPKRGFSMLGQDPAVNDGSVVTQLSVGQLEAFFVLRVVKAGGNANVTVSSASATADTTPPAVNQAPVFVTPDSAAGTAGTASTIEVDVAVPVEVDGVSAVAGQPYAAVDSPYAMRPHPSNWLWFDLNGDVRYLSGDQNMRELTSWAFRNAALPSIYSEGELELFFQALIARGWNHNRLWAVHSTGAAELFGTKNNAVPMPWVRSGGGTALDGEQRFDLTQLNQTYFDQLRYIVQTGHSYGLSFGIMLFDSEDFRGDPPTDAYSFVKGTPFWGPNNNNGIDIADPSDTGGWTGFFGSPTQAVIDIQRAYVAKVIDTLNDLPNYYYELSNETYAPTWKASLATYIRNYQSGKALQHMIMDSAGGRSVNHTWVDETPAQTMSQDLFAGGYGWRNEPSVGGNYRTDPPLITDYATKPGIADTDHIEAYLYPQSRTTSWRNGCRGHHYTMYETRNPDTVSQDWQEFFNPSLYPDQDSARHSAGKFAQYMNTRFSNLVNVYPDNTLASTGYCVAESGKEYLIFCPTTANLTVYSLVNSATYEYEFYNTSTNVVTTAGNQFVASGTSHVLTVPYTNAGCFIKRIS